jgi:hypothetical protein
MLGKSVIEASVGSLIQSVRASLGVPFGRPGIPLTLKQKDAATRYRSTLYEMVSGEKKKLGALENMLQDAREAADSARRHHQEVVLLSTELGVMRSIYTSIRDSGDPQELKDLDGSIEALQASLEDPTKAAARAIQEQQRVDVLVWRIDRVKLRIAAMEGAIDSAPV